MMKHVFILAVLMTSITLADVQPPEMEWNRTFGGIDVDLCNSVQQTSDGGYILAGYTNSYATHYADAWLIKTDAFGNHLWNHTFYASNYDDEFRCVQQTSDGGYILAGDTEPVGASLGDFWLVKTDGNGNQQWSKTFGGSNNDRCSYVIQTIDGGYMLIGYTASFGSSNDLWMIKVDASGNQQWNRIYGGADNDEGVIILQTADGGYAAAGNTVSYSHGSHDIWLIRTDGNGNLMWSKAYGGSEMEYCSGLVQASDGGFALSGSTLSYGAGGRDMWLVRTNASGDSLWSRTFGCGSWDECLSMKATFDGGYILAGYTSCFGSAGGWDLWLLKTDYNGDEEWNRTYGGASNEACYWVIQAADAGYVMAGGTGSYGAGSTDFWLVKTAPEGVAGYVTLESGGPPDWDYRLHWVRGSINRLVFRNVCPGTHGTTCNGASAAGWHATDYGDSVVFTTTTPLTSGSLVTFRLYHPLCSDVVTWAAGDSLGYIDGPLPVELLSFTASAGNGKVALNWSTASETDNELFEIVRDNTMVGRITASNSPTGSSYTWVETNLSNGREYSYTLFSVDVDGATEELATASATPFATAAAVTEYALYQNYPNPFNPETSISFDLVETGHVSLTICNPLGQAVETLLDKTLQSGHHTIAFDGAALPSGVYFYRLETTDFSATRKMVLMK